MIKFKFLFQESKKIRKKKRASFYSLNISNLQDIRLDRGNSLEGVLINIVQYSAY